MGTRASLKGIMLLTVAAVVGVVRISTPYPPRLGEAAEEVV